MADLNVTARWVFPVFCPPVEHGVLMISDGLVIGVARRERVTPDLDFGNAAIVPGFVNAHTHLDLTGAHGKAPPTADFTAWLRSVIAFRKTRTPEQVSADVLKGIADCQRFGTTTVGDISIEGRTRESLIGASMRSVVFHELIGLSDERSAAAWEGFEEWSKSFESSDRCRPGVSPHAPYSVSRNLYANATGAGLPLAIHLAESRDEMSLLEDRNGAFIPLLQELNAWFPENLIPDARWIAELRVDGHPRIAHPYLFVHCNYLGADTRIPPRGTVVYCPRTHAAFGHPPHPFREFLASGVRVALGTDSLASNPDLSVLVEARFIASRYSDFDRATLLRMATLNGAEALGWSDATGSLAPGKSADFAVIALPDRDESDPHELLFNSDLPVQSTWFRGECVFRQESQ